MARKIPRGSQGRRLGDGELEVPCPGENQRRTDRESERARSKPLCAHLKTNKTEHGVGFSPGIPEIAMFDFIF